MPPLSSIICISTLDMIIKSYGYKERDSISPLAHTQEVAHFIIIHPIMVHSLTRFWSKCYISHSTSGHTTSTTNLKKKAKPSPHTAIASNPATDSDIDHKYFHYIPHKSEDKSPSFLGYLTLALAAITHTNTLLSIYLHCNECTN